MRILGACSLASMLLHCLALPAEEVAHVQLVRTTGYLTLVFVGEGDVDGLAPA